MRIHAVATAMAVALLMMFVGATQAANRPDCQDSKLLSGKLITDICWTCMFPIRVAGITLVGGGSDVPTGASNKTMCVCKNKDKIPKVGLTFSMWMPARLVELVRAPGCSMALGGITLPLGDMRQQGSRGDAVFDSGDKAIYHYHTYAFPLLYMLDLFVDGLCFSDGYLDLDLVFMSELDPTWSEDELSFFFFLESAAVANPIAIAACGIDMTAATAGTPIDSMFWCAGGWGHLYPMSGHHDAMGSMAENTSLLATRSLAIAHRRGLAFRTKGDDALCGGVLDPMFPKSQYRMSMFFPVTEAGLTNVTNGMGQSVVSKGSHPIGLSSFLWGEWRSIPAIGEDSLYVTYRWVDCCMGVLGGDQGGL